MSIGHHHRVFDLHVPALAFRLRRALLLARLSLARRWWGRSRFRASRFLFVPPHLHLADPSVAADFLSGQIVLAGRSLLTGGRSVFDLAPPSLAFGVALHGFGWLRHFEASGHAAVRDGARGVLAPWLDRREQGTLPESEYPEAVPRRVVAWITHSALITEQADSTAYQRLLTHLARDAAMLRILADRRDIGMLRLEAAMALLFHALSLDRPLSAIREAEVLLMTAMAGCIAPDGGPMNRDAGSAVRLAADLIPLLALYRARQRPTPNDLGATLLKMVAFIRIMQHPDGGLALFNGAGQVTRDLVAQVTRFGGTRVERHDSAPDTGFERLEDEHAVVIADAGQLPAQHFSENAGAGALAFEFSTRSSRIIVNCGTPLSVEGEAARHFRSGAAHSGVLIDDSALATIEPVETILGRRQYRVDSPGPGAYPQRDRQSGRETLTIGHAGLRQETGYVVERRLMLLPQGGGLAGIDRILDVDNRNENHRVTLAFHLHPHVLPVPLSRQDAVVLRLPHQSPGRDLWLFESPGIALHLEESRCFEQDTALPKTEAIIVDLAITGTAEIPWRITPYRP